MVPPAVELKATLLTVLLHIVCGDADPDGIGLTATVAVLLLPAQPVAVTVGMIVYIAVPDALLLLLVKV